MAELTGDLSLREIEELREYCVKQASGGDWFTSFSELEIPTDDGGLLVSFHSGGDGYFMRTRAELDARVLGWTRDETPEEPSVYQRFEAKVQANYDAMRLGWQQYSPDEFLVNEGGIVAISETYDDLMNGGWDADYAENLMRYANPLRLVHKQRTRAWDCGEPSGTKTVMEAIFRRPCLIKGYALDESYVPQTPLPPAPPDAEKPETGSELRQALIIDYKRIEALTKDILADAAQPVEDRLNRLSRFLEWDEWRADGTVTFLGTDGMKSHINVVFEIDGGGAMRLGDRILYADGDYEGGEYEFSDAYFSDVAAEEIRINGRSGIFDAPDVTEELSAADRFKEKVQANFESAQGRWRALSPDDLIARAGEIALVKETYKGLMDGDRRLSELAALARLDDPLAAVCERRAADGADVNQAFLAVYQSEIAAAAGQSPGMAMQ
jgi:hypothetical protein